MAETPEDFGRAHDMLMCGSPVLSEKDLQQVAEALNLPSEDDPVGAARWRAARARVDADERSSRASGVHLTPTFFVNGRKYEGAWARSEERRAGKGCGGKGRYWWSPYN